MFASGEAQNMDPPPCYKSPQNKGGVAISNRGVWGERPAAAPNRGESPPPPSPEDRILERTAGIIYYPFRSPLALAQSLRIGFTATKGEGWLECGRLLEQVQETKLVRTLTLLVVSPAQ